MPLPGNFDEMKKGEKPLAKKKPLPEGEVKEAIRKAFTEESPEAFVWMPVPGPVGKSGIPDYVTCVPVTITPEMVGQKVGLFVGVEAKADKKEPTKIQHQVHKEIRDASGTVLTIAGKAAVAKLREFLRKVTHASQ